MMKTTVYIPQQLKRGLAAAASRSHRSEADLIREAIGKLLADQPALPEGRWGAGNSGDSEPMTAERFDALLSEGFGADGLQS